MIMELVARVVPIADLLQQENTKLWPLAPFA
jgi:hypothetical protein